MIRMITFITAALILSMGSVHADQKNNPTPNPIPNYPQPDPQKNGADTFAAGQRDPGPPAGLPGAPVIKPVDHKDQGDFVPSDGGAKSPLPPGGEAAIPQVKATGTPMMAADPNADNQNQDNAVQGNGGNVVSTPSDAAKSSGGAGSVRPLTKGFRTADVKSARGH